MANLQDLIAAASGLDARLLLTAALTLASHPQPPSPSTTI